MKKKKLKEEIEQLKKELANEKAKYKDSLFEDDIQKRVMQRLAYLHREALDNAYEQSVYFSDPILFMKPKKCNQ